MNSENPFEKLDTIKDKLTSKESTRTDVSLYAQKAAEYLRGYKKELSHDWDKFEKSKQREIIDLYKELEDLSLTRTSNKEEERRLMNQIDKTLGNLHSHKLSQTKNHTTEHIPPKTALKKQEPVGTTKKIETTASDNSKSKEVNSDENEIDINTVESCDQMMKDVVDMFADARRIREKLGYEYSNSKGRRTTELKGNFPFQMAINAFRKHYREAVNKIRSGQSLSVAEKEGLLGIYNNLVHHRQMMIDDAREKGLTINLDNEGGDEQAESNHLSNTESATESKKSRRKTPSNSELKRREDAWRMDYGLDIAPEDLKERQSRDRYIRSVQKSSTDVGEPVYDKDMVKTPDSLPEISGKETRFPGENERDEKQFEAKQKKKLDDLRQQVDQFVGKVPKDLVASLSGSEDFSLVNKKLKDIEKLISSYNADSDLTPAGMYAVSSERDEHIAELSEKIDGKSSSIQSLLRELESDYSTEKPEKEPESGPEKKYNALHDKSVREVREKITSDYKNTYKAKKAYEEAVEQVYQENKGFRKFFGLKPKGLEKQVENERLQYLQARKQYGKTLEYELPEHLKERNLDREQTEEWNRTVKAKLFERLVKRPIDIQLDKQKELALEGRSKIWAHKLAEKIFKHKFVAPVGAAAVFGTTAFITGGASIIPALGGAAAGMGARHYTGKAIEKNWVSKKEDNLKEMVSNGERAFSAEDFEKIEDEIVGATQSVERAKRFKKYGSLGAGALASALAGYGARTGMGWWPTPGGGESATQPIVTPEKPILDPRPPEFAVRGEVNNIGGDTDNSAPVEEVILDSKKTAQGSGSVVVAESPDAPAGEIKGAGESVRGWPLEKTEGGENLPESYGDKSEDYGQRFSENLVPGEEHSEDPVALDGYETPSDSPSGSTEIPMTSKVADSLELTTQELALSDQYFMETVNKLNKAPQYLAQSGDSFYKIGAGETAANYPPTTDWLHNNAPEEIKELLEDAIRTANQDRLLLGNLGFGATADRLDVGSSIDMRLMERLLNEIALAKGLDVPDTSELVPVNDVFAQRIEQVVKGMDFGKELPLVPDHPIPDNPPNYSVPDQIPETGWDGKNTWI